MMRYLLISVSLCAAGLVEARECSFDTGIGESGAALAYNPAYGVEIDIPNGQLITPEGTFLNEGYVGGLAGETMLFRGDGKTFLLSVARDGVARLTVHSLEAGPTAETFIGACEDR